MDADSNGEYTYIFKPLDTEAGMYIASATHPAIRDLENDAEFEIHREKPAWRDSS